MKYNIKQSIISLIAVAFLSAVVWRLEIELRWGWAGLAWVSGFHYAAVVICMLFAVWLAYFVPCSKADKMWIRSGIAFFGGIVSYFVYEFSFNLLYNRFPLPAGLYILPFCLAFVAIPFCLCILAWSFSPSFLKLSFLITPILFFASFPFASFLLWITSHRGGMDSIHAVKSGFIFLGFVVAAGLPFLLQRSRD